MSLIVRLANVDVSEDVLDCDIIRRAMSFPYALRATPSTLKVTLSDESGKYAPTNTSNFFVNNSYPRNAKKVPVQVTYKTEILFVGEVLEITQLSTGEIVLDSMDKSRAMRIDEMTNFGLSKSFKLIQDTEAGGIGGVYPLECGVAPVSRGSASGSRALGDALSVVDVIEDTGVLDSDKVQIRGNEVISEGGPINAVAGGAYPQMSIKSPLRYKYATTAVRAILQHYGITSSNIQVLPKNVEINFGSMGRLGYESIVGEIGSSNHLSWYGYLTDFFIDGSDFYFAISVPRGSPYFSRIVKYNEHTDEETLVYTHGTAGTELWGLAKVGNNIVMLLTDSANISASSDVPTVGSYDSAHQSKVYLAYFDETVSPVSVGTLVPKTSGLRPTLACFYQIGNKDPLYDPLWENEGAPGYTATDCRAQ